MTVILGGAILATGGFVSGETYKVGASDREWRSEAPEGHQYVLLIVDEAETTE